MQIYNDIKKTQFTRMLLWLMLILYAAHMTLSLAFFREAILQYHQWWRLFTFHFVHGNLSHMIGDGIAFYILSSMVYIRSRVECLVLLVMNVLLDGWIFLQYTTTIGLTGSSVLCYTFLAWIIADALSITYKHRAWISGFIVFGLGAFFTIWNIKLYYGMSSIAGGGHAFVPGHILAAIWGILVFCVFRVAGYLRSRPDTIPFFKTF